MSRDPEEHLKSSLKYYYLHRDKIRERRRKRYAEDHKQARAVMDPLLAARMAAMRSVPRRSLQHSWARNLLEEMDTSLGAEGMSHHSRKTLRWAFRLILAHAEKNGLAHTRDLIPAWLTGFPPQTKDPRKEPIYRANFGRMLLRLGLWSNEDYDLFEQNLEHSFKRSRTGDRPLPRPKGAPGRKVYFSPEELCHLAFVLAYRCGLSVGEIQGLRVEGIGPDGVRTSPNLGSHRPVSTISRLIR